MLTDTFALPFMRHALAGGVMLALLAGYFGVFVVLRRMSFLGNGLAHAAFGGVALGLLAGVAPIAIAFPFAVAVAVGIVWIERRTTLESDTAIGVFFAVSMAAGIALLSMRERNSVDAMTYLFGSILAIRVTDLWITGGLLAAAVVAAVPCWGRWAAATFDREMAEADRLPVALDDYLLAVWIALVVVCSVKLVGIVLATAFLVIPAAAARLMTRRLITMTLLSIGLSVASVVGGLILSYRYDPPAGAAIVLVQAALFAFGLVVGFLRHR
jgi:zinc transport system permease protein